MPGQIITMQDVHDFGARIPVMGYVRGKRNAVANLWIFHSPKNNLRFAIQTDRDFRGFVLLEGDVAIERYIPYPIHDVLASAKTKRDFAPTAQVFKTDGSAEWWVFSSAEELPASGASGGAQPRTHSDGRPIKYFDRASFKGRELEFDNWLLLTSAINRNRNYSKHVETALLEKIRKSKPQFTLDEAMTYAGADPSLMLSAVASLMHRGLIVTELKRVLLTRKSIINWAT